MESNTLYHHKLVSKKQENKCPKYWTIRAPAFTVFYDIHIIKNLYPWKSTTYFTK